jgi:hypothetical protein
VGGDEELRLAARPRDPVLPEPFGPSTTFTRSSGVHSEWTERYPCTDSDASTARMVPHVDGTLPQA